MKLRQGRYWWLSRWTKELPPLPPLLFLQKGTGLDFDPRIKTDLPEGGMGLHIMEQVMDDVTYFVRDGRN